MTLTNTVTSFAHDAAQVASDLGGQAVELGSKAAELGSDAAASVASAATHIAQALSSKVPAIKPRRTASPLAIVAVLVGVAVIIAAVVKLKRKPTSPASSGKDSAAATLRVPVTDLLMG